MKIAVIGGSGDLGRRIVAALGARQHQVRILSRTSPSYQVDLTTGEGLATALEGCDAVIDSSNAQRRAHETFVAGSRRLLAAEASAGISHHLSVSIVGCDLVPFGYYQAKAAQEQVVASSTEVGWTILRATQFHSLVGGLFSASARRGILPLVHVPLQTVSPDEVARAIADVIEGGPRRSRVEVAGPQIEDARDLARTWKSITSSRALPVKIPMPGKIGRALRSGTLTSPEPEFRGQQTFAASLHS